MGCLPSWYVLNRKRPDAGAYAVPAADCQWVFTNGNAIEQIIENGKTYFAIRDYGALRSLFATLLAEVQRIKSEGDYRAGKALVEQYAIKIDQPLHKEVLKRYAALELKPYGALSILIWYRYTTRMGS